MHILLKNCVGQCEVGTCDLINSGFD